MSISRICIFAFPIFQFIHHSAFREMIKTAEFFAILAKYRLGRSLGRRRRTPARRRRSHRLHRQSDATGSRKRNSRSRKPPATLRSLKYGGTSPSAQRVKVVEGPQAAGTIEENRREKPFAGNYLLHKHSGNAAMTRPKGTEVGAKFAICSVNGADKNEMWQKPR